MSAPAIGLLKLLAGAGAALVRPAGPAAPAAGGAAGADFQALLEQARKGEISSGRRVELARGCGVSLSESQLERVALAADRAEAQGATRALVFIDGMALRLDVTTREVTGLADLSAGGVLTGIDAVVGVPPAAGSGADAPAAGVPGPPPLPTAAIGSDSLLRALGARRPAGAN